MLLLRSAISWLAVTMLVLMGPFGNFVCLGQDGRVGIGGTDPDCCHEAPQYEPDGHSATLDSPADCCIDIAIPPIDPFPQAKQTDGNPDVSRRTSGGSPDEGILPLTPPAICEAAGLAAREGRPLDGAPPPLVATTILLL